MAYDVYTGYTYTSDVAALISAGVPANKICVGLMPGTDDLGVFTSLSDVVSTGNYVLTNGLAGVMFWDLNRDLDNVTTLGPSATSDALYNILS